MLIAPVIIIISVVMLMLNFTLAKKETQEREKPSPFECGFDPMESARLPFSVQFFLVAVIFLIFDVELTLILPSVTNMFSLDNLITPLILVIFVMLLIMGLYIEWNQKALDWYM